MTTLAITIGRGKKNPRGRSVAIRDDISPARGVAELLESSARDVEVWWSPHSWKGGHRNSENWIGASSVAIDVDFYDANGEHVAPPGELAAAVDQVAREGKLPGSVYHSTPRGFRLVFSLAAAATDREIFARAAKGAGALVSAALRQLRLIGYIVDEGVLLDTARFLYSPHAIVDEQQRDAAVLVLNDEPYSAESLAPPTPLLRPAPALTFQEASRRYNADHAREWPRNGGDCPACGHKECFGRLPDDATRWACFSTNHTPSIGVRGKKCFHGDALDLDAHAAGAQPAELLRRQGYLAAAVVDDKVEVRRTPEQQQIAGTVVSIEQGKLRGLSKSYASLCAILRNDRKIVPERLEWNEMLSNPTAGGVSLEDEDVAALREKIELVVKDSRGKGLQFRTGDIEQAVKQVASEHKYNPVREYLEHLEWDGTSRIAHVAEDILGIPATELTQTLLRKWFISAAARPLSPGCQVDHVLVLQGPQGPGKSTFFRKLAGDEWFTDQHFDIASDDGSRIVRRFWVIEWAELETMHRSRSGMVKGFISRRVDTFRPPYARRHVDAPRHCVIVGTVNPEKFLTDPTGNRRFWVIPVHENFNLELLTEWRDQLWGEAVRLFRSGEQWHLTPHEAELLEESQEEFKEESHPWQGIVAEWLTGWTGDITTAAVLEKAIRKPTGQWVKSDEMVVGNVMHALGYRRERARRGELKDGKRDRLYVWVSPPSPPVPASKTEMGT